MSLLLLVIIIPTIASAQTSPCEYGTDVLVNPTKFAVVSLDHATPLLVRYKLVIRRFFDSQIVQEFIFSKEAMTAHGSNCYTSPAYVIDPSLPRDGNTQYTAWIRAEDENGTDSASSNWVTNLAPFVLASAPTKLRVEALVLK